MAVRFSEEAQRICRGAHVEASRYGQEYVGTEPLLLALVQERSSLPVHILTRIGVTVDDLRLRIERAIRAIPVAEFDSAANLPHTPRAKSAIEFTIVETRSMGEKLVRAEHLFLGLLRETDGVACVVLNELGVTVDGVREAISLERERARQILRWLAWNGGTPTAIARSVAEGRNWDGLPILADALEEAGCSDREILDHLRQENVHPCPAALETGCWVLDRLLSAVPVDESAQKRWWQCWK